MGTNIDIEPATLDLDKMNIDSTQAKALWEALFAISLAVEQLGLEQHVNSFRHVETDVGAFAFAKSAIQNAIIDGEE